MVDLGILWVELCAWARGGLGHLGQTGRACQSGMPCGGPARGGLVAMYLVNYCLWFGVGSMGQVLVVCVVQCEQGV